MTMAEIWLYDAVYCLRRNMRKRALGALANALRELRK